MALKTIHINSNVVTCPCDCKVVGFHFCDKDSSTGSVSVTAKRVNKFSTMTFKTVYAPSRKKYSQHTAFIFPAIPGLVPNPVTLISFSSNLYRNGNVEISRASASSSENFVLKIYADRSGANGFAPRPDVEPRVIFTTTDTVNDVATGGFGGTGSNATPSAYAPNSFTFDIEGYGQVVIPKTKFEENIEIVDTFHAAQEIKDKVISDEVAQQISICSGTYDSTNGAITPLESPVLLLEGDTISCPGAINSETGEVLLSGFLLAEV